MLTLKVKSGDSVNTFKDSYLTVSGVQGQTFNVIGATNGFSNAAGTAAERTIILKYKSDKITVITEIKDFKGDGGVKFGGGDYVNSSAFTTNGTYKTVLNSTSTHNSSPILVMWLDSSTIANSSASVKVTLLEGDYTNIDIPNNLQPGFNSTFEKEGKIIVKATGKNILNMAQMPRIDSRITFIDGNFKFSTTDVRGSNSSMFDPSVSGMASNLNTSKLNRYPKVKPNTTYSVYIAEILHNGTAVNSAISFHRADGTHIRWAEIRPNTLYTHTTPNDCEYIDLKIGMNNPQGQQYDYEMNKAQVYEGALSSLSKDTYEDYKEDKLEVTTEPFRSIYNVHDDGEFIRVGQKIINLTTIGKASEFTNAAVWSCYFSSSILGNKPFDRTVLLDRLRLTTNEDKSKIDYLTYLVSSAGSVAFAIPKTSIVGWDESWTDAEKNNKSKDYINSLNITATYELATPIARNLQPLELATQGTKTYVSFENEVQPYSTFNVTTASNVGELVAENTHLIKELVEENKALDTEIKAVDKKTTDNKTDIDTLKKDKLDSSILEMHTGENGYMKLPGNHVWIWGTQAFAAGTGVSKLTITTPVTIKTPLNCVASLSAADDDVSKTVTSVAIINVNATTYNLIVNVANATAIQNFKVNYFIIAEV